MYTPAVQKAKQKKNINTCTENLTDKRMLWHIHMSVKKIRVSANDLQVRKKVLEVLVVHSQSAYKWDHCHRRVLCSTIHKTSNSHALMCGGYRAAAKACDQREG